MPSLDPSLAERGEDLWREAQAAQQQSHDGMLYLNEDGFFTQTKPQEPPSPGSVHEDSDADEPAPAPAVRHTYKRPTSAFVFGEAEESDEDEQRGDHGGLAGVFSDKGSDSEKEEGSEDDADLSSLLDDESDSDNDEKDEAARKMFMQHQQEDDAAAQALHERATKGLLRHRRRGREDDMLADMLDEDADEDELRRRLQAPRFAKSKRRQVEGDGLDALAAREDAQAFVRTYTETHTTADDHAKYDFLHADDSSSEDEERVSAHTIRTEILRASRQRAASPDLLDPTHSDHDEIGVKLSSRAAPKRAATTMSDDEDAHVRMKPTNNVSTPRFSSRQGKWTCHHYHGMLRKSGHVCWKSTATSLPGKTAEAVVVVSTDVEVDLRSALRRCLSHALLSLLSQHPLCWSTVY